MRTLVLVGIAAVATGMALPADAAIFAAGKNPATDCYARFKVGEEANLVTRNTLGCVDNDVNCDGDPADGTCSFSVSLCINQGDETGTCTAPGPGAPLKSVKPKKVAKKLGIAPPADLASVDCGSAVTVPVRVKKNGKAGKAVLMSQAVASTAPKKDKDKLTLFCCRDANDPKCSERIEFGCSGIPDVECPANLNGGPDELFLRVGDEGTDLDNGWTGIAHNFPVPSCSPLKLCLSGCDASANPICDINGPTGAGSINGTTFGPPLPLITQAVPVCVINNYQQAVTGKVNIQTGEILPDNPLRVNLFSDVHFTATDAVCPRCAGPNAKDIGGTGKCDSGANEGQACTVESKIDVVLADGNKTYTLSSVCVPTSLQFAGRLDIRLPLTTGTSSLTGPKPCTAKPGEPVGVAVQDDNCQGAPCTNACAGTVDQKGGLNQTCCGGDPSRPCFPTAGGGTIQRTGNPGVAVDNDGMAWPAGTYPKTTEQGALAATFCEPATTRSVINSTTGLPGPGALILPGFQALLKQ